MAGQPWLAHLQSARDTTEQVITLKALKNQIIGHPPKKAALVKSGVLDPVVRLTFNKSARRRDGKAQERSLMRELLSGEEMVRLQALHVIASIAHGGPSYLNTLHTSSALSAILSNICPLYNPAQLVLAALRALSNLADAVTRAGGSGISSTSTLAEALFTRQHITSLGHILSQTSPSPTIQSQISIAASIISRVCREERHQQNLVNYGVLGALATKLASFVVADGCIVPGADELAQRDGVQEFFPDPAPDNSSFADVLEAISVIIMDSKFRASHLLYSPSLLAIFPSTRPLDLVPSLSTSAAWNAFTSAGLGTRPSQLNALDFLLPAVPLHPSKSALAHTSAFPPLGAPSSREHDGRSSSNKYTSSSSMTWPEGPETDIGPNDQGSPIEPDEAESPLIPYLILAMRSRGGMERLMAASVLTILYRAGLTSKTRDIAIGLLVVPVLVHMLDEVPVKGDTRQQAILEERTPAILAMLITDSEYLQKAAYDAGFVTRLSKMIKVSYNPVPDNFLPRPWAPRDDNDYEDIEESCHDSLGDDGQSELLVHNIKVRESTLKAIAALVPFKDEYRKAIVDQGIIPYIVESMSTNPGKPTPKTVDKNDKGTSTTLGSEANKQSFGVNPVNVLIAACGAIRALSRSVSILRTTLIDNGVAMPVFRLLRHPEIEVQIAATAAVCNLVTDVSPMRDVITEAGLLKILCEHARSTNAKLRLNAVWALKHFVHGVSNDMKRLCLDELGQGWLVQLICDDTEDEALLSSKGKSDRTAGDDEMDEDVEMDQSEDEQPHRGLSPDRPPILIRPSSGRSKSFQRAELRLASLRDAETNPARKARKDDIAVQEQGLDFIRNLIGGAGQGGTLETTEMIDFLFNALGQDRVFEILASKVRPKVINPFNRRSAPSADTKVVPPQSEIITAVTYILVHMAASVPRHRQIVISQTELLRLLVPHFNHPSPEVRLALVHLTVNITWTENGEDRKACAERSLALKNLGFLERLEVLQTDGELNVRERCKSALFQMKQFV
ncbi:armadillo repeat protein-like protein [Coleophoma cylindrospora]|uniref:Armadillo repeat protein-like protein n=1 Tax=Coleophoma cylindrospora TaxID=1849047 RepID=A0A3D8SE50_9HELO|nr:armadillo repeat protein-like protein [Coleophoma cylindrospora]